jgi:hypothetical protein
VLQIFFSELIHSYLRAQFLVQIAESLTARSGDLEHFRNEELFIQEGNNNFRNGCLRLKLGHYITHSYKRCPHAAAIPIVYSAFRIQALVLPLNVSFEKHCNFESGPLEPILPNLLHDNCPEVIVKLFED